LKFEVYRDGKLLEQLDLCGEYLFGSDGIPYHGSARIAFENGIIECTKRSPEAAGLALLWPVQGFGKLLLTTTRLPETQRHYNLNIELARTKLMEITIKREDWSSYEEEGDLASILQKAKSLFVDALQHIADPPKAAQYADESLRQSLIFAEMFAGKYAGVMFEVRRRSQSLGRHVLGCQLDPAMIGKTEYLERLLGLFGFVTIPLNWADIEPVRGEYDFAAVDAVVEAIGTRKLAICAGPLLRFEPEHLPRWLLESNMGFEKIRDTAYDYVTRMVTRYARYIHAWKIISGINALNHFGFRFEQILELTRASTLAVRAASSRSVKVIDIVWPWCEYYANSPDTTVPPMIYADMIVQSGINFDAFGLEIIFGKNRPGMHVRDLMRISARLDDFASMNRPLHITTVGVPGKCGDNEFDCGNAGFWRAEWSEKVQAHWIDQFYRIALSKPMINTVTWMGLADGASLPLPSGGLLTESLQPKEAYKILARLQRQILGK
jgi:hypothetical protein